MSETAAEKPANKIVNELRVSAHLMTLDTGLFCIVSSPSKAADAVAGLPGVRVTLSPGPAGRPEAVTICGFRDDGWMTPFGDAALVRIHQGPAQVMVTVYQAPNAPEGSAPNLQVLRLSDAAVAPQPRAAAAPVMGGAVMPHRTGAPPVAPRMMDMLAHIQGAGDIGCMLGERVGEPGSGRWIEGFAVAPTTGVAVADIEYQAVLGRDWLSPWVEGGQFCGSRGMALPLLGLRLRLKGEAAEKFDCTYAATFVDGSTVGPVPAGEPCESPELAAMESMVIEIHPKGGARPAKPARKPAASKAAAKRK
jgi:hypothetical protein